MFIYIMLALYIFFGVFVFLMFRSLIFNKDLIIKNKVYYVILGLYIVFSSSLIWGILSNSYPLANILTRIGNIWLGFHFYVFCLLVVVKIFLLFNNISLKLKRILAISILMMSVGINVYGIYHANQIQTIKYDLNIDKECAVDNLKIAFIADTHIGAQIDEKLLNKMVAKVNEIKPDIILIGGDIFNSNYDSIEDVDSVEVSLKSLQANLGVYAVYGNHDVKETLVAGFAVSPSVNAKKDERMDNMLKNCNINLLEDEKIGILNDSITLIGRRDALKLGRKNLEQQSIDSLFKGVDLTKPCIVLEHEPIELEQLANLGTDLVLSGHTHDGQFFPLNIANKILNKNSHGLLQINNMASIVTSGVGFYGAPIRVLTNSEVVEINIMFSVNK